MQNKIERHKMQIRDWVKKHPEKIKEYSIFQAKKHSERYHNDPEFRKKAMERARQYGRERYRELRNAVVQKLGGKCSYCGCNVPEALEINHINGGGCKELKRPRTTDGKMVRICPKNLFRDILAGKRSDINLACRVCNALHLLKLKGIIGHIVLWTPETVF